jgi:hypothetical protein
MPLLEEIECYMTGLWLLLRGRPEGIAWLDLSRRGFWRSWWAAFYCLPPAVLGWLDLRRSYLSAMPDGTAAGGSFFLKMLAVEMSIWIVPAIALAVVADIGGLSEATFALIVVTNWMALPIQWLGVIQEIVSLFAPDNIDASLSVMLVLLVISGVAYGLVLYRVTAGRLALTLAIVVAMAVANAYTQFALLNSFGF